jgi:hypothetical protein
LVRRGRYRCRRCHYSIQSYIDPDLDESGLLPLTLERSLNVAKLIPYRQACDLIERWGLRISKTKLAQMDEKFNVIQAQEGLKALEGLSKKPLPHRLVQKNARDTMGHDFKRLRERPRTWIIEVDGKFVPIRTKKGFVYEEIKTVVLYKMRCPDERFYFSTLERVDNFSTGVHGLLRHAGVCQEDFLIGVSDGAKWIEGLLGYLGVHQHILDVYHASTYLDTVMKGLGWDEVQRTEERRLLLSGKINIQKWINRNLTDTKFKEDEVEKAARYLRHQSLLGHTDYPEFRAKGFEVIGSGQIEGANKSVIGARLNVGGAHWTEDGANGMVFARGEWASERPIVDFHPIRHLAFRQAA